MPDIFISKKARLQTPERSNGGQAQSHSATHVEQQKDGNLVTLFSSFVEDPTNISFHHQEADEKILLFLRSHLITNLRWVLILLIFAILPPLVFILGVNNLPFPPLPGNFTTAILLIYYVGLFAYAFSSFLTWYFNIFVITKKRVIDIDFAGLVFHDVAETQFTLLQDVNYTQSGPIGHLLNFGDVFAQTAGGKENLEALGVPKPAKVTTFITKNMGGRSIGNV